METITTKKIFEELGKLTGIANNDDNYVVITFENGSALYSYRTLVAIYCNYHHYFTNKHDYNITTCKHVKRYCGMDVKTIRKSLYDGTSTLIFDN